MRLDPNDPFDVYFALRLAFVDRPDVRIRTQERAKSPGSDRFAPDPTLWCVDAYVHDEAQAASVELPSSLFERKLTQPGDLYGVTKALGLGVGAVAARDLWESPDGVAVLGGWVDKRTGRRSFAAEVLASETPS